MSEEAVREAVKFLLRVECRKTCKEWLENILKYPTECSGCSVKENFDNILNEENNIPS